MEDPEGLARRKVISEQLLRKAGYVASETVAKQTKFTDSVRLISAAERRTVPCDRHVVQTAPKRRYIIKTLTTSEADGRSNGHRAQNTQPPLAGHSGRPLYRGTDCFQVHARIHAACFNGVLRGLLALKRR